MLDQQTLPSRTVAMAVRMARLTAVLAVAFAGVWTTECRACSIPVFRYALEHWAPDSYRITIFHEAPLSDEDLEQIARIRGRCETANAVVQVVSTSSELDSDLQDLWDSIKSPEHPVLVLQWPRSTPGTESNPHQIVWSGPLRDVDPETLCASPVRTEIIRALDAGVSAAWVFLESGNKEHDDARFAQLQAEAARLEQTLKLEPIDPADLAELNGSPTELKVRFDCVRVSRTDAAERMFVEMLLSVEPDLRDPEYAKEAMVFPIFGRGRVLYALVGDGIGSTMIEECGRFLTGGCQCKVKAQNPGTDMLLTAGWETYVASPEPEEPVYVPIPTKTRTEPASEELAITESPVVRPQSETPPSNFPGLPKSFVVVIIGVLILGAGLLWIRPR